jgi:DNA repair exonuclease SbcCD ATPase subunit
VSQLAVVPELEEELDKLFELPPAEFTAARNDLAQRLKRAGQQGPAARVQALRKPTIPVWAINQLARRRPDDVDALIAAGDNLRAAQEAVLAGGEREQLRAATSAERDALRKLTQQANELLSSEGQRPAAAVLERIAATVRSAALDERGRDLLAAGMLVEELESSGFGAFEGMKIAVRSKPARGGTKQTGAAEERRRRERIRKLRERVKKLSAAAAEAEREADRAETEAARERRKAERAAEAAARAEAELEAAEGRTPD